MALRMFLELKYSQGITRVTFEHWHYLLLRVITMDARCHAHNSICIGNNNRLRIENTLQEPLDGYAKKQVVRCGHQTANARDPHCLKNF